MNIFGSANILLPRTDKGVNMETWAVIACDQFTSQPEYWDEARNKVGDAPSALRLILPEAELPASPDRIAGIHATMKQYLDEGLFQEYKDAYVYVERTQLDGSIRKGLVGAVDLEEYDSGLRPQSGGRLLAIRATEGTVPERIPPRRAVREGAPARVVRKRRLLDISSCFHRT